MLKMDTRQIYWTLLIGLCVYRVRAQNCDSNTCSLPACYCAKAGTPGQLNSSSIPQTVLFMFDGSVSALHYPYYEAIFTDSRRNPNGCPIGGTVFVSDNYTDYSAVRKLFLKGVEIGVNSATRPLSDTWKNADLDLVKYEIQTQKDNLVVKARVPREEIWGWRSPGLQSAGRFQFDILQQTGFEYDSTVVTTGYAGKTNIPGWPFTLDFPYPEKCQIAPCPSERYPGLWEIPVVPVRDIKDQNACSHLGGCSNRPKNKAEVLTFLRKNFEANYKSSRAPVYFNLRTSWLAEDPFKLEGLVDFIKELVAMDDVYILTAHQLLAWVRDPQPLSKSKSFAPWSCPDFVKNEIGIWDQIKNIFTEGTGKGAIIPEVIVTEKPRRVNEISYVSGVSGLRGSFWVSVLLSSAIMLMKVL